MLNRKNKDFKNVGLAQSHCYLNEPFRKQKTERKATIKSKKERKQKNRFNGHSFIHLLSSLVEKKPILTSNNLKTFSIR
jgi:hypothetical protein